MKIILGLFSYGGVEEKTVDSVLYEIAAASQSGKDIGYNRFSGDALIARSRSRVLGNFLNKKIGDVLVMIDHDMEWRPGDVSFIAEQAVEKNCLVGGLYCKRAMGKGWSSRVPIQGSIEFGKDKGLIETDCLATGFLAIPLTVAQKLYDELHIDTDAYKARQAKLIEEGKIDELLRLHDMSIARIQDGAWKLADHDYYDFFRCFRLPSNSKEPNIYQFISEDWAFSQRCKYIGIKSYISTYPIIHHHGQYSYSVADGMDPEAIKAHNAHQNTTSNKGSHQGTRGTKKRVRKRRRP